MEIHSFFLQLMLILFTARLFGELAAKLNVPSVIGELFAGILMGPTLLNLIEVNDVIKLLAEIGIILLLFEVGIETDIGRLAKTGSKPFIVAMVGVILPFVFGFYVSNQFFGLNTLTALFIGGTLTATSIGITVRVLTDLKKQRTEESQIVLGAAVLDDVIGIIVLSILYDFSKGGGVNLIGVTQILIFICLFLLLAPLLAKIISSLIRQYSKKSQIPGLLPTSIVSLILFFAWLAHEIGAPQLLGGFAAGLALSRQFYLPFGRSFKPISPGFAHQVETQMKPIIHLFTPIFFVTIGLSLNFHLINWHSSFIWLFSITILAVAILGKLLSGFSLFKENPWIKWAVGLAMIPRGEVGLIFAEMGKTSGVFDNDLYASLILVIAITTIFTPFVMRIFYDYQLKYVNLDKVS